MHCHRIRKKCTVTEFVRKKCTVTEFVTAEEVHRSLALAEDRLRGREALRARIPSNLMVYDDPAEPMSPEPGFIPSRRSLKTRIEHWISGYQA